MSGPPSPSSLDAVLVALESPGRAPSRRQEEPVEQYTRSKAADVRPPRHPADVFRTDPRERAADELAQEPEEEIHHRWHLEEEGEEEDREQGDDPSARKEDEVGAQNPGNGAGGADGGNGGVGIGKPVSESRCEASEQVEK